MCKQPYLICICGCKNSGKTTLISKLIKEFCELNYKVATIKHDGHDFECDVPNTDTYKYMKSGAYGSAIFSENKFMIVKKQKETKEQELINIFPEADIIILEGLKNSEYPKYEIVRKGNSEISICNKINLLGIISDMSEIEGVEKIIDLNNVKLVVENILIHMKKFNRDNKY